MRMSSARRTRVDRRAGRPRAARRDEFFEAGLGLGARSGGRDGVWLFAQWLGSDGTEDGLDQRRRDRAVVGVAPRSASPAPARGGRSAAAAGRSGSALRRRRRAGRRRSCRRGSRGRRPRGSSCRRPRRRGRRGRPGSGPRPRRAGRSPRAARRPLDELPLRLGARQHHRVHALVAAEAVEHLREERVRLAVVERDVGRRADDDDDPLGRRRRAAPAPRGRARSRRGSTPPSGPG